jgi:hypothetical protein
MACIANHSLKCGDSLVGLNLLQLYAFNFKPLENNSICKQEIDNILFSCTRLREQIRDLSYADTKSSLDIEKSRHKLFIELDKQTNKARCIGDLILSVFFDENLKNETSRSKELIVRYNRLLPYLEGSIIFPDDLIKLANNFRDKLSSFHWELEFPEIFCSQKSGFDCIVGNPPFLGGGKISGIFGNKYKDWLLILHEQSHGNSDYCAHFFRRSSTLLGKCGILGLIATNTISQGDTRTTGLKYLCNNGWVIYDATPNLPWPGSATVVVSICHLAKGDFIEQIKNDIQLHYVEN